MRAVVDAGYLPLGGIFDMVFMAITEVFLGAIRLYKLMITWVELQG